MQCGLSIGCIGVLLPVSGLISIKSDVWGVPRLLEVLDQRCRMHGACVCACEDAGWVYHCRRMLYL